MKETQFIQYLRNSLKTLAQSIESMYCYTYQLEQVYLHLEDSEIFESRNQFDEAKKSLLLANDILSNYDYSAQPF